MWFSKEPHQHQSFSKRYQPASSSTPSNSLSQLPFKPRQKLPKPALTPGQQQCHPSTFPPTTLLLYIAPSSKKLKRLLAFFPCSIYHPAPMHGFLKHWSRSALMFISTRCNIAGRMQIFSCIRSSTPQAELWSKLRTSIPAASSPTPTSTCL